MLHGEYTCTIEVAVGASLLRVSYSHPPSVLSWCCPLVMQELNSINCEVQLWCCIKLH